MKLAEGLRHSSPPDCSRFTLAYGLTPIYGLGGKTGGCAQHHALRARAIPALPRSRISQIGPGRAASPPLLFLLALSPGQRAVSERRTRCRAVYELIRTMASSIAARPSHDRAPMSVGARQPRRLPLVANRRAAATINDWGGPFRRALEEDLWPGGERRLATDMPNPASGAARRRDRGRSHSGTTPPLRRYWPDERRA